MTDKKRIPFDLKRALAGDKVVTRDGQEVQQLFYFDKASGDRKKLVFVIEESIDCAHDDGTFSNNTHESVYDLFMAPKVKKLYIAIFNSPNEKGYYNSSPAYLNKKEIEDSLYFDKEQYTIHEIEIIE